jgi:hypothetical protein
MKSWFRIISNALVTGAFMSDLGRELMRGVVVGTGKRLDEVGQRFATLLTRLFMPRDVQESKTRLEKPSAPPTPSFFIELESDAQVSTG